MSLTCCTLTLDSTVNEVLLCHPDVASVFNAFGVDACCGGAASLRDAARSVGILPQTLLFAVESVVTEAHEAAR